MTIRALLLDVMGTLVSEPFTSDVPEFFGVTVEEINKIGENSLRDPVAYHDFECGRIDEATYLQRFFIDRRPIDGDALARCLSHSYTWLDGIEDILESLRMAEVDMYALSNYGQWYTLIEAKLELSRFLDWRFVSCKTGLRKPQPEAYLGAARALSLSPSQCLFVDDRIDNVQGATAVGMPAVLFESAPSLRDALREYGLPA